MGAERQTEATGHTSPRSPVSGPHVWTGADLEHDHTWMVPLGDAAVDDLDRLVQVAADKGLGIPFDDGEAPLGSLGDVLDRATDLLDHGPGLALLRGLPRHRYTEEQCALIYWAIGVRLGRPVSQNSKGQVIGHVRDLGLSLSDPSVRVYQTNAKLDYHADKLPVDVLGLFCLEGAKEGGQSKIVSAMTVHNIVGNERPDLLDVLYQPFNLDWRDEEPDGEKPWYRLPMFSRPEGDGGDRPDNLVTSRFTSLAYFRSVGRHGDHLALSAEQTEALEYVQAVANRPGMALSMSFEPGDIQLLNNHVMLHARDAYVDHREPERRRHLLRIWIAYPDDRRRALSPQLAERYRYVTMGGIPAKGRQDL